MALYEVSARTTLVTATIAAALCALRADTVKRTRIREISIFYVQGPTTSGGLGLARSTALGTGTLTAVTALPRDTGEPATNAQIVTAWATAAPTNGGIATVFRRFHAPPTTIGNGVIWTFDDDELIVPLGGAVNGELCIVNTVATAPGTFDVSMVLEV